MTEPARPKQRRMARAGEPIDLALTLPVFVAYHLGVVFLNVKNASDVVTGLLLQVAEGSKAMYLLLTGAIGLVFAGVFVWRSKGQAFRLSKFVQIAVEGVVYALLMRLAGAYVVGALFAGKVHLGGFAGVVMSLGAGFYEELTYRLLLFGGGLWLLRMPLFTSLTKTLVTLAWAVVCAAIFSAVHYFGPLGDTFELRSFVFRLVLGLALTAIFSFRGFAAAVWAHAAYDIWVLVL
ncbi:MAG TPA: CPBP family glutamic-type intramembrane protease [Polyangiaceae bacterium]|nr:CPBP family glutamic-type intramembrane protease [Polyangiaceae bacterium]